MWRDLLYGVRSLRHSRTFTLAAIIALGLAIGVNATIFSLVDGLWLRPSGFANVGRSVRIFATTENTRFARWSYPEYVALRDGTASFSGVVACGRRGTFVPSASGDPELALLNVVSLNFFQTLGVVAAHGRLFGADDEAPLEEQPGVVLGHAFWRRRFGADPSVIGRTIRLGTGRPVITTILAVLPPSFRELDAAADRDLWVPPATWRRLGNAEDFSDPGFRWFDVIAVLRPGMTVRAANEELRAVVSGLARDLPATSTGRSARAVSDFDYRMETGGTNALALITLVFFVVVITVVNVANLMVSRAVSQGREMAVRVALGAGRRRLLGAQIAESVVLGAAGTIAGLLLALWLIRLLPALVVQPPGFRAVLLFGVDGRVLGLTIALALTVTVLTSLAPAYATLRGDVAALVKTGPTTAPAGGRRRFGGALAIAQVAVSLALLSSAGLLARSFLETGRSDLGFARKPVLTAWVTGGEIPRATTEIAVQRLSALPGVTSVALAIRAPLSLSGGGLAQRVQLPGDAAAPRAGDAPEVKFGAVSANYFDTMGIRIVQGRAFTDVDERSGESVIVVNEEFASRFLAESTRVGAVVRIGGAGGADHRVIGVARNATINRIDETPEPFFYQPFWRDRHAEFTFLVETIGDDAVPVAAARDLLKAIDPRLEPRQLVTMDQYIRYSAGDYQATAALATALATIGLLLTAVGVYGVIASRTTRRTRELGIRIALGATRWEVLALVLGDGGRVALYGLLIGLPAALVTSQLLRTLLFGVEPWDALALGGAMALLGLTVLAATLVPAWRAARLNPSTTLRESP